MGHADESLEALADAHAERELVDWDTYDDIHLVRAELSLKEAHVHAMLVVAEETRTAALVAFYNAAERRGAHDQSTYDLLEQIKERLELGRWMSS